MKGDVEIAQGIQLKPIQDIAAKIGLAPEDIEMWGNNKAKVLYHVWPRVKDKQDGHLILVTTINPTSTGEGKTTTVIGLTQALAKLGKKAMLSIREPSLGPCMGIKGGAAGGGYSQVLPMEDINLHFTGDMYAVAAAHNLLAAMVDKHMHFGNEMQIDARKIVWPRVIDMNDRSLRRVVVGLGGEAHGVPHEEKFYITAASEIMAILCLADDINDLKERLGRIVVAYTYADKPITAKDMKGVGAMAMLLKHAIKPNLVQTIEGVPAFVHGGPFANIAHGTSSLISMKLGLKLVDYLITEAGFGSDLGAEKYFNIVCRQGGLKPSAGVVVVTLKAMKRHGGVPLDKVSDPNSQALKMGLMNLSKHLENVRMFGVPAMVAINCFPGDDADEVAMVKDLCQRLEIPVAVSHVYEKGGEGGLELAEGVLNLIEKGGASFRHLYNLDMPVKEKIEEIALKVYGASEVSYSAQAEEDIEIINRIGLDKLSICMAKTPYSLSDDHTKLGRPKRFKLRVREVRVSAGAGFLVPITGRITTMPGLPRHPAAENMDMDSEGRISGLF
jgi:formate--tetrahydrofolate ligase